MRTFLIPMYNETANLGTTVPRLCAYLREAFPDGDYEILFVDDGSTDGSADLCEKLADDRTRVLRNTPNRGKGNAVRTGMLAAAGDVVIFTDCDLAYGCEVLSEMAALFDAHPEYDAIVGSRVLAEDGYAGYSFARKLFSKTYRAVLRLFFGLKLSDSQSGIKGFRRAAIGRVFPYCEVDRYAFDFEAIMIGQKAGVRFGEMPARVLDNKPGKIRVFHDSFVMLRDLFRIKRRVRRLKFEENQPTRVS